MSHFDDFSSASMRASDSIGGLGLVGHLLMRLLRNVRYGHLRITLPSGLVVEKSGAEPGPEAIVNMRRWRMLTRLIVAGDIGFAESYLDEDWTTPDLTAVIRFAARNTQALAPAIQGSAIMRLFNRAKHLFNANTKHGSRRNIEAHYDLGNEFYRQWLDPMMLYSSGIYDDCPHTLEAAQQKKLEQVLKKLALDHNQSVLEIGCGWGALSVFLAARANAKVTGITLSPSQLAWARQAAASADVTEKVDLRLQDYRDLDGQFDRIVSIEMFEAVGEAYWPEYFSTLKRCLRPGGKAVLQVISIEEKRFDAYRRGSDFIQKHVFPGGFLPTDSALEAAVAKAGFRLAAREHFGKSYAQTLLEWRTRFHARWPTITALGFDERFRRLWHYYLCYCEAGFEEGSVDVGLYTLEHA
jgi:cyclopropane-fatty-acyl-phospholipid synthase